MKRILIFIFLCVFIVGCENNQATNNEEVIAEFSMEKTGEETDNAIAEADKETDIISEEPEDLDLVGQALLDSIEGQMPEKLYIEGVTKSQGMTMESKTYILGENLRYESGDGEDLQIMIYNGEEGVTYSYSVNENMGFIYYDDEEEDYELDEDEDYFDLEDAILLTADIRTFNGQDVLYIESETSTDEGIWLTKQWLHLKYLQAYKYESYYNGMLETSYEAGLITDNFQVESSLFQPPEEIDFQELDSMFDFELP